MIRGTCVDAKGQPLKGCQVAFDCQGGVDEKRRTNGYSLDPIVTGADGRFEARVLAGRGTETNLRISLDGFVPKTGLWVHLAPGSTDDLGKIEMRCGVYARGRVVNRRGVGLPGVYVSFRRLPITLPKSKRSEQSMHEVARRLSRALSGADGAFRSRDALPPGEHAFTVSGHLIRLVQPEKIVIPEKGEAKPATIIVRAPRSISGRVLDDAGQPVANVVLVTDGIAGLTRSMPDGSFRLYAAKKSNKAFRLRVLDGDRCESGLRTAELDWGKHDIVLRLKRLPTVPLTVVDVSTGKPVEHYSIRTYSLTEHGSRNRRLRQSGKHKAGRMIATGIARGAGRLVVVPKDPRLHVAVVEVVGADKMAPLRVRVQRLVPMKILVVDPKGDLLANRVVRVITKGNNRIDNRHFLRRPRSPGGGANSSNPTVVFDTVIFESKTDAAGQCILYGLRGRDDLIISIGKGRRDGVWFPDIAFGPKHLSRKFRLEK